MYEESDESLLRRIPTDTDAVETFYRRHVGRIQSFAVRRAHSPDQAADLVAGVFLAVLESADRFDPRRGRAVPWLYGVAANVAAAERRRWSREQDTTGRVAGRRLLDDDDIGELEAQIDAARAMRPLQEALARLDEPERQILELVSVDGLTPSAAAHALGIAAPAARMRLMRARVHLRAQLDAPSNDPVPDGPRAPARPESARLLPLPEVTP